ncbi:MAG TPA: hypothetical protein VGV92_04675 [Gammaproteobacteria bacterium]|nr:hypothetical protein [Gammaproteobacteria bacterium]
MEQQQPTPPNTKLLESASAKNKPVQWPFDELATHTIFSLLEKTHLPQVSLTCGFFYKHAKIFADRAITLACKTQGIRKELLPNTSSIALLPYIDIFARPIATGPYTSKIDARIPIEPRISTLALCRLKNNGGFCFVGTFALPTVDRTAAKICQFVAGVDNNGFVFVKRLSDAELKSSFGLSQGDTYLTRLAPSAILDLTRMLCCASIMRQPATLEGIINVLEPYFNVGIQCKSHRTTGDLVTTNMARFIREKQPATKALTF